MRVDVLGRQFFPPQPEGASNESVVGVGYGKWPCAVAVVCCLPVFRCCGSFFWKADQNRLVEFRIVGRDVVVHVHGVQCFPKDVCRQGA